MMNALIVALIVVLMFMGISAICRIIEHGIIIRKLKTGNVEITDKRCPAKKIINVMLDDEAVMPNNAYGQSVGYDLYATHSASIWGQDSETFGTGFHVQLPDNMAGVIISKSGLNILYDITSTGLIDPGYTGEIKVKLHNHSRVKYRVEKGDKIAQLVFVPVITPELKLVDHFDESERGDKGFGSSGK